MNHREWVGPVRVWDLMPAHVMTVLWNTYGLRRWHRVFDFGCGSFRVGRLLIPYLDKHNYVGIDVCQEAVNLGMENEVGSIFKTRAAEVEIQSKESFPELNPKWLASFDFVLMQSMLSHAGRGLVDRYLSAAISLLTSKQNKGILLASFLPGATNYPGDPWTFVYPKGIKYRRDFILEKSKKAGFSKSCVEDLRHPNHLVWLLARK